MRILSGVLALGTFFAAVALLGFEQGTYFVVDLVDGGESAPAAGRIAVEADFLKPVGAERNDAVGVAESEFFVGFGTEGPSTGRSAFEVPGADFGAGENEEEEPFGSFGTETEADSGSAFSFD